MDVNEIKEYCNKRGIIFLLKKPKTYFEYYILAKTNRILHLIKSPIEQHILIWADDPNNDISDTGYNLFYEGYDEKLKKYKDIIYYYFGL